MTSDKKTRGSATAHRRPLDPEERFQRRVTLAFIALTVAIVAVVVIGIGYGYWDQHLKPVASVERRRHLQGRMGRPGTPGDVPAGAPGPAGHAGHRRGHAHRRPGRRAPDGHHDRPGRCRAAAPSSRSSTSCSRASWPARRASPSRTRTWMPRWPRTPTSPRHASIGLITITPEVGSDGETTGAARQAALTAANEAVAALAAGTAFEDVARKYSTDATKDKGGDYGSIFANDTTLDPALVAAIFAANQGDTTPLLTNADGSYSIARVDGHHARDRRRELREGSPRGHVLGRVPRERAQGDRRGQARRVHRHGCHDRRPAAAPSRRDLARR